MFDKACVDECSCHTVFYPLVNKRIYKNLYRKVYDENDIDRQYANNIFIFGEVSKFWI